MQRPDSRLVARRSCLRAAFEQAVDALAYARASDRDAWEYAIEMDSLVKVGLTVGDLRWMVTQGYLQHAVEVTSVSDSQRRFLGGQNLAFPRQTCFVLSAAGELFAASLSDNRQILSLAEMDRSSPGKRATLQPQWDRVSRMLTLGDQLVKRYRVPSPTQELILGVFQEEGWPSHIVDPLRPDPVAHPKTRVHDAIKCLNRNQNLHLIQFRGDGTGEGIFWELTGQGCRLAQGARGKNRGNDHGQLRLSRAA